MSRQSRTMTPRPSAEALTVERLARRLMAKHGLSDWTFKLDNARVRFGICNKIQKRSQLVVITLRITQPNRCETRCCTR